tara:strand:- start:161 stop:505 length:345 start_codon:yes stop_codon:yes gene_type:complete
LIEVARLIFVREYRLLSYYGAISINVAEEVFLSIALVRIIVGDKKLFVQGRTLVASLLRSLRHFDWWRCHVFIWHSAKDMSQAIQAGASFFIGLNGEPWGFWHMCFGKHGVLRL